MEKIIFDGLIFVLVLIFTCFLPGRAYLYFRKIDLSILETFTLSISLGLTAFTLANFIFGVLGVRWIALLIILLIDVLFILKRSKDRKGMTSFLTPKWTRQNRLFLLILILGIFGQVSLVAAGGMPTGDGGLTLVDRDGFWHIGLIEELTKKIPPLHPGFAPIALTNYHYFYDLFVSSFKVIYPFSALDLYCRFVPILLSALLGLSVFILARRLFQSEKIATLATFLTYFTGSLAFLIPLFLPKQPWGESSFWVAQTFSMLTNQPFSLSISLFLMGIFALRQNLHLPMVLLLGTQLAFKVYGGIIALGALGAVSVWQILREKKINLLLGFFAAAIISFLLFYSNNTIGGAEGFLIFAPGWYLRAMVENPDRLNIIDWVLREETLLYYGSFLGILRLRLQEFVIFLVGNLGIRLIGLIGLIAFLKNLKKLTDTEVFLWVAAAIAFIMPMLFIQKGSVANTIQFFYYLLIILDLYTAKIIANTLKNRKLLVRGLVFTILLFFLLPTTFQTWQIHSNLARAAIGKEEMAAIEFLKEKTDKEAIILLFPSQGNTYSLYISALSGRRTYYSDRLMSENTLKDYKSREKNSLKFFTTQDMPWAKNFLKENDIAYVYLNKGDEPKFNGLDRYLPVVFENKIISIYRVP